MNIKHLGLAIIMGASCGFSAAALANDHVERQTLLDPNLAQVQQQAIALLDNRGYSIAKIEVDTHMNRPSLEVKAYKNGLAYDIELLYPTLEIVKEKIDD